MIVVAAAVQYRGLPHKGFVRTLHMGLNHSELRVVGHSEQEGMILTLPVQ